jgi:TRAP-type mannitol/chloroaromatic compound transport system permease small subunit
MADEVFSRYVLNAPTIYAHELAGMFFAIIFLMGGSYALRWNSHINVEILYNRFPPRVRAAIDLVTWLLFYLFVGVVFVQSIDFAAESVQRMERSNTAWEPYIWPVKLFLPLGTGLMLLAGLVKTIKDVVMVITGRPLIPETEDDEKEGGFLNV